MFYKATNQDGTDFGAVARIITETGEISSSEEKVVCTGTNRLLILVKVFVQADSQIEWKKLKRELSEIEKNYEQLLNEHLMIYQPLFFFV